MDKLGGDQLNIDELREFVEYVSGLEKDKQFWKQKYYKEVEYLQSQLRELESEITVLRAVNREGRN